MLSGALIGALVGLFFVLVLSTTPADVKKDTSEHLPEKNLIDDPNVLLVEGFESEDWSDRWTGKTRDRVNLIGTSDELLFEPLQNKALCINVVEGTHYGASYRYLFQEQLGEEPEEIYFRYYLRFASDWDPVKGGKLPGIGGTYGRAAYAGITSDGYNGWSSRGLFNGQRDDGRTGIGSYCYHVDQAGKYGDSWPWRIDLLGYLENNRWYCVEHYVQLNTPMKNDGILRGWVDGELAFERNDMRWRDTADLKIDCVWLEVYHGGKWKPETDNHLFFDNVVISREYIGPMKP